MGLTTASICTAPFALQINVFIKIMNDKYLHINYLYFTLKVSVSVRVVACIARSSQQISVSVHSILK